MEKKATLKAALRSHGRAVKLLHSISPHFFPVTALFSLVSALLPYVTVFFSSRILRELAVFRREEMLWRWVIGGLAATALCGGLKAFLNQRVETLLSDLWGRKEQLFTRKKFSMDFADVDSQPIRDLRNQIAQIENWSGWGFGRTPELFRKAMESLLGILGGISLTVSLFTRKVPESMGAFAVLNQPLFILLLAGLILLISLIAGFLEAKASSYWSQASEAATEGNRLFGFFGFIGMKRGRNCDIRIYDQQRLVDAYWSSGNAFRVDGVMGKLARGPLGLCSSLSQAVTALLTGFVYLFTCLKAWAGAFDVGSVTQYVGAVTALARNVHELTALVGQLKVNTQYLEKTYEFLDIPNKMYQGTLTTEKRSDRQYEVEFRNVSFRYPGSEIWALKNVSFKFRVGSRLAIVGENGSGKTTFIKLLCRLYDPQEGQILLNGIDIRKYDYRDYMNIFAVVFQDFQLISQPLGNNVAGSSRVDRGRAEKALRDAGFGDRLDTLPQGLETQLYKNYGKEGVDLSGGEAQKVAIARALYKDAPFIILDEPTAALDPIAEAEIYSRFNDIVGDKTAIYISHRLSSCKFCDEIAVFDHGKIVQQGTHETLTCQPGKYQTLWNAQAQYYTK